MMWKKLFAILCCFCLVFSCGCLFASADERIIKVDVGDSIEMSVNGVYLSQSYATYGYSPYPVLVHLTSTYAGSNVVYSAGGYFDTPLSAGKQYTFSYYVFFGASYEQHYQSMTASVYCNYSTTATSEIKATVEPTRVETSNGAYFGYRVTGTFYAEKDIDFIMWEGSINTASTTILWYGGLTSLEISYDYDPQTDDKTYPGYDEENSAMDDLEDKEGQLNDSIQSGIDGAHDYNTNAVDSLLSYVNAFQVVAQLTNEVILGIPIFGILLNLSVSIGLFAFLLGMAAILFSRISKERGGRK